MRVPRFLKLAGTAAAMVLLMGLVGPLMAEDSTSSAAEEAVFVTNMGGNYVTIYDLNSSGDAAPRANIGGTFVDRVFGSLTERASGLDDPSGVVLDPVGNIYVANMSGGGNYTGTILVFRAGAHGSATPIAKIDGPDTGLRTLKAIAVDSTGKIYATRQEYLYDGSPPGINVYAAGSTGNVKPIAVIRGPNTCIENLEGIAVDSKGSIYVTSNYVMNNAEFSSVLVFPLGSNGDVRPSGFIGRSKTGAVGALTLDSKGNIYVVKLSGSDLARRQSIAIYRAESNGDVPPVATISGPKTGLADPNYTISGIAVDSTGNIYAAGEGSRGKGNRVIVYASGSDGDVQPQAIIEGPHTRLDGAHGVAIGHFAAP
jgi:hypothetical protein